jgi:hypothetical protein
VGKQYYSPENVLIIFELAPVAHIEPMLVKKPVNGHYQLLPECIIYHSELKKDIIQ